MALYLPIRSVNRSSQVRIDGQVVLPTATTYVDVSKGSVRRELAQHHSLAQIYPVGGLTSSNADVVVAWGVDADEGAANNDMVVRAYKGELRSRSTGAYVAVAQTDVTLSAADVTNPRIDILQVNTTTGVVTKKNGTAAATPAAPAPDASNITLYEISVPANDTAITTNQFTDKRPR